MKLVLTRKGQFALVNMRENMQRCGALGGRVVEYEVVIHATDERLSPEGFVMENSRCQKYFEQKYSSGRPWNAISCERMAMDAAREIGEMLLKENISVTGVSCTIVGSNLAQINAEWSIDEAVEQQQPQISRTVESAADVKDGVPVLGRISRETPKAVLVGGRWFPKSKVQIERNGQSVRLVVPRWLAEEKGVVEPQAVA